MNLPNIYRKKISNLLYGFATVNVRAISCWSCGTDAKNSANKLFCSNCKRIQKPEDKNYFKVIGIEEIFDVNNEELSLKFKELQRHLHPDKFGNKDKTELEISEMYSSLVNEAYKTLLDPLSRGIYLLEIKGLEMPDETEYDQEFLMEIMEKNEEVEDASTDDQIIKLNEDNRVMIGNLHKEISSAFHSGNLDKVTKLLGRLKYYTSIDNQIKSVIRAKGIVR